MADEDVRRETIGGKSLQRPAPAPAEREAALSIEIALREYTKENGGWVSDGPREVALDYSDVVVPDVVYIAPGFESRTQERTIRGAPTLVVEISTADAVARDVRANMYASYNVPEYWRVDPEAHVIERWTQPSEGRYSKIEVFGDDLWSEVLPDFVLSLDDVFPSE